MDVQDSLRVLDVWFRYGGSPQVYAAVERGISTVPIETWLQVRVVMT
jgi:hypothetical protein